MRSAAYRIGHPIAKRSDRTNARRRGAAVAELAICLPVLLLISISLIELSSMIFVKQALAVAAYEAAHRGVQPAATSADAIATAQEILRQRRVTDAQIQVSEEISNLPSGQFFTVNIVAPAAPNCIAIFRVFNRATLDASVSAMKETDPSS